MFAYSNHKPYKTTTCKLLSNSKKKKKLFQNRLDHRHFFFFLLFFHPNLRNTFFSSSASFMSCFGLLDMYNFMFIDFFSVCLFVFYFFIFFFQLTKCSLNPQNVMIWDKVKGNVHKLCNVIEFLGHFFCSFWHKENLINSTETYGDGSYMRKRAASP